jgi:hypothetical protein
MYAGVALALPMAVRAMGLLPFLLLRVRMRAPRGAYTRPLASTAICMGPLSTAGPQACKEPLEYRRAKKVPPPPVTRAPTNTVLSKGDTHASWSCHSFGL